MVKTQAHSEFFLSRFKLFLLRTLRGSRRLAAIEFFLPQIIAKKNSPKLAVSSQFIQSNCFHFKSFQTSLHSYLNVISPRFQVQVTFSHSSHRFLIRKSSHSFEFLIDLQFLFQVQHEFVLVFKWPRASSTTFFQKNY